MVLLIGWWLGFLWFCIGILWCITIIGIPVGIQCIKMGRLALWPFNMKVIVDDNSSINLIINIIWIVFFGALLAVINLGVAIICFITIIGIPFGKQLLKMAKLSLFPFGAKVEKDDK